MAFAQRVCTTFDVFPEWLIFGRGPMRPGETAPAAPNSAPLPTQASPSTAPASTAPAARPLPAPLPAQKVTCALCAKLEARLDNMELERRELTAENRELTAEVRHLWRENGELREKCARLEERQYQRSGHGDTATVGSAG